MTTFETSDLSTIWFDTTSIPYVSYPYILTSSTDTVWINNDNLWTSIDNSQIIINNNPLTREEILEQMNIKDIEQFLRKKKLENIKKTNNV